MKKEFRIKASDIKSTDIPGIMEEIEAMKLDIHTAVDFDIEAAATQISIDDEDYVVEYDDGSTIPEKTREEKLLAELELPELEDGQYFQIDFADDNRFFSVSICENENHICYVEEDLDCLDFIDHKISGMNQSELIEYANDLEGKSGRSFEESAKYWSEKGYSDYADKFQQMASRWWELEQ